MPKAPNLHFVHTCDDCRHSYITYDYGTMDCKKFDLPDLDDGQVCDAWEAQS